MYEKPQIENGKDDAAGNAGQEDLPGEIGIDPGHDEETGDIRREEGSCQARQEHAGKEDMVPAGAHSQIEKTTERTCNTKG